MKNIYCRIYKYIKALVSSDQVFNKFQHGCILLFKKKKNLKKNPTNLGDVHFDPQSLMGARGIMPWILHVCFIQKFYYSPLSKVLDHQVAAYVKGDILSNFLYILIIFKGQIHKDDLSELNFLWWHVKEQSKVVQK